MMPDLQGGEGCSLSVKQQVDTEIESKFIAFKPDTKSKIKR